MEETKMKRIGELARKSKTVGLTEDEKNEQKLLREEYIRDYRNNLKAMLDNTYVQNPDGTRTKLGGEKNEGK